ncbi:hypothetical protein AB0N17_45235 [Streptomyces sp. NPDC051133]|uniref:hypothetical protein n=1 Tax=Streptomyces sp. NPDC051133 TaxID=3155521 RepID=UPI00343FFAAD
MVDCLWHARIRPTYFVLACGDGNSRLSSLMWSHWGFRSAVAQGYSVVNDCKPYCALGTFHSYPVTIRLSGPKPLKDDAQHLHYTQLTISYEGYNRPEGFPQTLVYPLQY